MKKLTLSLLSNPVPFNGEDCQKQKRPRTSDQSLFRLENKFGKIPLLVLNKFVDVIQSDFLSYSKNYMLINARQLMIS